MFEWLVTPDAWIALGTITALEIVLGIDNIIFLSVLVGRLPEKHRVLARRLGLGLAMIARLAFLFSISWRLFRYSEPKHEKLPFLIPQ